MKKLTQLFFITIATSIIACSEDTYLIKEQLEDNPSDALISNSSLINSVYNAKSNHKRSFGLALAKAMKESASLRKLIKEKALEKFDEDYDVLFNTIKDERLNEGYTVEGLIRKHLKNNADLDIIMQAFPTLTIFVPELPMGSFSANNWRENEQIPKVAIRLHSTNDVPIIDSEGNEVILKAQYIPSEPIVVIKENERVVYNGQSDSNNNALKLNATTESNFKFVDACFNKKLNDSKGLDKARLAYQYEIDTKILDAYDIYKNTDGWHRDYIYYGISPTTTKGPFNYDFEEHITSFSFVNGQDGYNTIADQTDDPKFNGIVLSGNLGSWTGGSFEFKVKVLVNGKNGVGSEIIKYFGAAPNQLFEVAYNKVLNFYILSTITAKTMSLNIPIIKWDLNQYSTSIKYSIEEVDLATTTMIQESTTSSFATNFGIDVDSILKKIGLKLGANFSSQQATTYTRTITYGNDELGDVIVNFADNVVISDPIPWIPSSLRAIKEYSSGKYIITVEPKKVQ